MDPGEGTSGYAQEMADLRKSVEDLRQKLARAEIHRDKLDIRGSNDRRRGPRKSGCKK